MTLYQNTDIGAPQFSQDVVGEALKQSLSSLGLGDESLSSVMESAKEGLLNLCTNVGLIIVNQMMEQELNEKLGPKGKHNPNRQGYRNGYEDGSVVLGGCKHAIRLNQPTNGNPTLAVSNALAGFYFCAYLFSICFPKRA